ncbi:MAG: hypothetical protein FXF47_03970 [Candidatus Mcinerneyibacterium aminivorans]|uniref:peptidylprolyl isomerase n=1 Tax=Candidatus Mcinerneyibacterium aminivorans TaxID=2703815 RepID=A0A5D0MGE5_9BACT|nr:MAG: hypothetical protein FXF47_03970 [Candidatus Mcinerneyibacterium aminivorans]
MKSKIIYLVIFALVILISCSITEKNDQRKTVVAKINENEITLGELNDYFNFTLGNYTDKNQNLKKLKYDFLKTMINEEIILDVAKKEKIEINDFQLEKEIDLIKSQYKNEKQFEEILKKNNVNFEKFKKYLKRKWLVRIVEEQLIFSNIKVTNLEISKYYSNHKEDYVRPRSVEVKEIILDTQKEAENIMNRLRDGESFDDIYVALTGKIEEDNTNIYTKNELPENFAEELFSLRTGSYTKVLKGEYNNYHIFKLERKLYKSRIGYSDEVKESIRKLLLYRKREVRYKQWINSLKKRNYKIMINESYFNN